MSRLSEQRLIIRELVQTTSIHRARLREACRTINPSVDTIDRGKCAAGSALMAADIVSVITAVTRAFRKDQTPSERCHRLTAVFLETPRLLRTFRRLRPQDAP